MGRSVGWIFLTLAGAARTLTYTLLLVPPLPFALRLSTAPAAGLGQRRNGGAGDMGKRLALEQGGGACLLGAGPGLAVVGGSERRYTGVARGRAHLFEAVAEECKAN